MNNFLMSHEAEKEITKVFPVLEKEENPEKGCGMVSCSQLFEPDDGCVQCYGFVLIPMAW